MKFIKTEAPVLSPSADIKWASGAVFNPAAWFDNGQIHLLFRSIPKGYKSKQLENNNIGEPDTGFDDNYVSYIGYASSEDGINFKWRKEPFITPTESFNKFGAEDPRISKIDDLFLITYTALSHPAFGKIDGVRIGLASTKDFKTIDNHGIVGPANHSDKDAVIFPRRIQGKIVMLHRIVPNIQLIAFDDLEQLFNSSQKVWEKHLNILGEYVVMRPMFEWESKKIGAGPTPIETEEGWLLIYHGVDDNHVYRMGVALLDLDNPQIVIARAPVPVLEPELGFEVYGDVPNVVFPEGAIIMNGNLHIYYGAADSNIGHAQIEMKELLTWLLEFKKLQVS